MADRIVKQVNEERQILLRKCIIAHITNDIVRPYDSSWEDFQLYWDELGTWDEAEEIFVMPEKLSDMEVDAILKEEAKWRTQ